MRSIRSLRLVKLAKFAFLAAMLLALSAPLDARAATGTYALVMVDLGTGQLTSMGCVGVSGTVGGFALKDASTGYALASRNRLATFSLSDPSAVSNSVTISGLARGESLIGIDIRPATGELYGISDDSRVFVINPTTGAATAKGAAFSPRLSGGAVGFDFNPTVDRIRVITERGQNLRLNPDTGQVAAVDGSLAYAAGDVNEGRRPRVSGAGYTNSVAGATTTTLYDIDTSRDVLVTQLPPNNGTLNTVGALGNNVQTVAGFDILPSGQAYAVVRGSRLC